MDTRGRGYNEVTIENARTTEVKKFSYYGNAGLDAQHVIVERLPVEGGKSDLLRITTGQGYEHSSKTIVIVPASEVKITARTRSR